MLMTPMTPKVMARPMAASKSTEPSEIPYQAFCTASQTPRRFWMAATATAAAFHHRRRGVGRQAGEEPEGVLIAALADNVHGGELVFIAGLVVGQNDRGARLQQRALDPRVLLLGDGGIESRQRACARDLNTACAASYRAAGLLASSVSPPTAASIAPRSRLLRRTVSRSVGASPAIGCPVAASVSVPASSLM